ncbi:MAG: M56 family metallopeptidase [Lachnospiraceae bacterium]
MEQIFLVVLQMSFTASVVIGVVLVLRLFLKPAPKIFSYMLWSVVLFRLLCPFEMESSIGMPDTFKTLGMRLYKVML